MDIDAVPIFALADRRLSWLDQRQALLSRNVANVDTPGFKPADLAPFAQALAGTASGLGANLAPLRTDPGHLAGTLPQGSFAATPSDAADQQPDGNAVSLDDQLTKLADTDSAHELVTQLYQKYLAMFRTAIGR